MVILKNETNTRNILPFVLFYNQFIHTFNNFPLTNIYFTLLKQKGWNEIYKLLIAENEEEKKKLIIKIAAIMCDRFEDMFDLAGSNGLICLVVDGHSGPTKKKCVEKRLVGRVRMKNNAVRKLIRKFFFLKKISNSNSHSDSFLANTFAIIGERNEQKKFAKQSLASAFSLEFVLMILIADEVKVKLQESHNTLLYGVENLEADQTMHLVGKQDMEKYLNVVVTVDYDMPALYGMKMVSPLNTRKFYLDPEDIQSKTELSPLGIAVSFAASGCDNQPLKNGIVSSSFISRFGIIFKFFF